MAGAGEGKCERRREEQTGPQTGSTHICDVFNDQWCSAKGLFRCKVRHRHCAARVDNVDCHDPVLFLWKRGNKRKGEKRRKSELWAALEMV